LHRIPSGFRHLRKGFQSLRNGLYRDAMCASHKKTLTLARMTPKIDMLVFGGGLLDAPATGCIFSVAVLDHALPGLHRTAGLPHRHTDQATLGSGRLHIRLRALWNAGHPNDLPQGDKDRGCVRLPATTCAPGCRRAQRRRIEGLTKLSAPVRMLCQGGENALEQALDRRA
jgi:hypothetical protein